MLNRPSRLGENDRMGGLVRYLRLKAQAQIGLSPGVLIFGILAVLCAATTFILLVFAAFIWLAERYTPLTAALVLCGFFLLLTILAGIGSLVSRRTLDRRAQREMRARGASPLFDPKMLGVGLQIGAQRRLAPDGAAGCRRHHRRRRRPRVVHERRAGHRRARRRRRSHRLRSRPHRAGERRRVRAPSASRAMRLSSSIRRTRASTESKLSSWRIQSMKATSMVWP